MKIVIEVDSKFDVSNIVTVKFAGSDFGEYDIEGGTIADLRYSSDRDCIVYDVLLFSDGKIYKNIQESQIS